MTSGATTGERGQRITQQTNSHLETCRPCRELDELWNQLIGAPETNTDRPAPEPNWKEAPEPGTAAGPSGRGWKGRPLPPENTCPECGKWKKPQYDTCFACSGMTLCNECGVNYHSQEYEVCYQCSQDMWDDEDW